jgi:hypothetical protein
MEICTGLSHCEPGGEYFSDWIGRQGGAIADFFRMEGGFELQSASGTAWEDFNDFGWLKECAARVGGIAGVSESGERFFSDT